MSNFNVKSLLEAKNPQAIMLEQTRGLKNKWSKTGLLEGLKERDQHSMAVLLENQAQQLLAESSQTNANGQNSEEWSGVALPLVRRIFGEIAAKEFVSVQPMNLPSGLIFFMDFKYGNTKGDKVALTSVYGGTGAKFGRTDAVSGGLYGNGTYGYSLPSQSIVTSVPATVTSASWADAGFRQEYSASIAGAASQLRKVVIPVSSISGSDVEAVKSFILAGTNIVANLAEFATHNYAADTYTFIVSASGNGPGTSLTSVKYSLQPSAYTRGDFEDQNPIYNGAAAPSTGANLNIPEIDLELKSESIVAKTRKLKAVWTPELAQDLNAYHSIDAEAELTALLSEYVSMEIDLEILDMLIQNAPAVTTDYWSARIGSEYDATTGLFKDTAANRTAYVKSTWFQTLGNKIQKVSNKIHQ